MVRYVKSTAVIPVSICVCCSKALSSCQKLGETFRQFSIKLRGAVTDCQFVAPCAHAVSGMLCTRANCCGVDYTDSVVRDILSSIYDVKIRRGVLFHPSMLNKSINKIICTIEGKESARDAIALSAPTQSVLVKVLWEV